MPAPPSEVEAAAARLRGAPPSAVVSWAVQRFGGGLAIASSFSIEDCVVIDMAHKVVGGGGGVHVFALDTGRLPDETYLVAERVRMKYGLEIAWFFPAQKPVEDLV